MYNVNLRNIVPSGDLTCLFAKATLDESNLWHRRLGHVNFKTINKLVKGNLVSGLPTKTENKDKGKSPVVTITGFKDLNAEFEECANNSSNGVNAASYSVSTVGHNFINSTNDFSVASPSNTAASLTVANSSSQDASTSSHDS
nr:ribonuclease H-like domain-containing protein [Tanacetum cinerariifolium]